MVTLDVIYSHNIRYRTFIILNVVTLPWELVTGTTILLLTILRLNARTLIYNLEEESMDCTITDFLSKYEGHSWNKIDVNFKNHLKLTVMCISLLRGTKQHSE